MATTWYGRMQRKHASARYSYNGAPLKFCASCKTTNVIEVKAGTVCMNCKVAIHNPCRNCSLTHTIGVTSSLGERFIECLDCQFME